MSEHGRAGAKRNLRGAPRRPAAALLVGALLLAFAIAGWMAPMAVIGPMTIFVFGIALEGSAGRSFV